MNSELAGRFRAMRRHHFFRYGLPMLTLLVVGSFGLKEFTQLRYRYRKTTVLTDAEMEEMDIILKKPNKRTNIAKEYEKLQTDDLDTWENIRGPRPWEDSKTVQDLQRQALAQK